MVEAGGWVERTTKVALVSPGVSGPVEVVGSTYEARIEPIVEPGCHDRLDGEAEPPVGAIRPPTAPLETV